MTQPTTTGFHHIGLVSADASRTDAFYGELLGLRRLRPAVTDAEAGAEPGLRQGDESGGEPGLRHGGESGAGPGLCYGDEAGVPGTLVSFRVDPRGRRGRPGIGGMHHLAFGTENEEMLLMWKRRLMDGGVHVTGPYDRGYFTSVYFSDPDGQVVEIATSGPGYTVDEPADALGRGLMIPPQRIVRGYRDERAIAGLVHREPVPAITAGMALLGLHHVSGITDDLGRAGDFVEDALGMRMVKRTTNRDDPAQLHYFWAAWRDGAIAPHSAYTLFGWPAGWHRVREGTGQVERVAFRDGGAGLDAWRDHLRSRGIAVADVPDESSWRGITFAAPDGTRLAIAADPLA
jgi:glyoxalase family protein